MDASDKLYNILTDSWDGMAMSPSEARKAIDRILSKRKAKDIQPEQLRNLFKGLVDNFDGLGMDKAEARTLAVDLFRADVDPSKLTSMYKILRDSFDGLGMSAGEGRTVAVQMVSTYPEVSPRAVSALYRALRDSFDGLGMASQEAKDVAVDLAMRGVDAGELGPIYKFLRDSWDGMKLPSGEARTLALQLSRSHVPASVLKEAKSRHRDVEDIVRAAVEKATPRDMTRYAKNGNLYTIPEFEQYYKKDWLLEWSGGLEERRYENDGKAYSKKEFVAFFGHGADKRWERASELKEKRLTPNGYEWLVADFFDRYAGEWIKHWMTARCA